LVILFISVHLGLDAVVGSCYRTHTLALASKYLSDAKAKRTAPKTCAFCIASKVVSAE